MKPRQILFFQKAALSLYHAPKTKEIHAPAKITKPILRGDK